MLRSRRKTERPVDNRRAGYPSCPESGFHRRLDGSLKVYLLEKLFVEPLVPLARWPGRQPCLTLVAGHCPAPCYWRNIAPAFITKVTFCSAAMSSSGLPSTAT